MKATNSDSKRCQVSVDVSLQPPRCFQRKKARTFSSQAKGRRPHRLLLGGVQSKQRRNHLCGGNVLMYAANFQYLVVTTADHGKFIVASIHRPSLRACSRIDVLTPDENVGDQVAMFRNLETRPHFQLIGDLVSKPRNKTAKKSSFSRAHGFKTTSERYIFQN